MKVKFKKILIANRGEIAVRIIRACKELGIISAAVYSDSDIASLHVKIADEAYHIGESVSSKSYLNKDKIIDLAKRIGADAVHPGYGFFSENYDFIESVEKAGLTFIGPSSKSVKLMGSKTAARKLMTESGVQVVPGTTTPVDSLEKGIAIAEKIGFPVLLKASAGGGGKGMRRISSADEFDSAFQSAKREALSAFADDSIYIEKFIENPKHIEVQIIADKHGNYVHLFERECSIQRRHQKIIEEAPSSFVDEITREKITGAAINAAKSCNYHNAGTIEFLMDERKDFYFLEMNTRVQVEHPVTEMITGIDIVKEQISIASENRLSFKQDDVKISGHSMECRIYAEDPRNNFLPSSGKIMEYKEPGGPGVRVDSGFCRGSEISVFYDPLIAKLVCWADSRSAVINKMNRALEEFQVAGLINNIGILISIIESGEFRNGSYNINFIEKEFSALINKKEIDLQKAAAISAVLLKSGNPLLGTLKVSQSGESRTSPNEKLRNAASNNKWTEQQYE